MEAKFRVGDRVRFTGKVCQWATYNVRRRTRRVVRVVYDADHQCCFYQLGGRGGLNEWAENGYWFRSYELYPVNGQGNKIGRPSKRELRKSGSKVLSAPPNQKSSHQTPKQIPHYLDIKNLASDKANTPQAQILISERQGVYNG